MCNSCTSEQLQVVTNDRIDDFIAYFEALPEETRNAFQQQFNDFRQGYAHFVEQVFNHRLDGSRISRYQRSFTEQWDTFTRAVEGGVPAMPAQKKYRMKNTTLSQGAVPSDKLQEIMVHLQQKEMKYSQVAKEGISFKEGVSFQIDTSMLNEGEKPQEIDKDPLDDLLESEPEPASEYYEDGSPDQ